MKTERGYNWIPRTVTAASCCDLLPPTFQSCTPPSYLFLFFVLTFISFPPVYPKRYLVYNNLLSPSFNRLLHLVFMFLSPVITNLYLLSSTLLPIPVYPNHCLGCILSPFNRSLQMVFIFLLPILTFTCFPPCSLYLSILTIHYLGSTFTFLQSFTSPDFHVSTSCPNLHLFSLLSTCPHPHRYLASTFTSLLQSLPSFTYI